MIEIITQFFKSNDLKRQEEIDRCFSENINNKFVKNIHFLYENDVDMEYSKKFKSDKIIYYPLKKRINYKDVVVYANNNLENKVCVYLHADMHATDDFGKLDNFNKNDIYALTSHHPKKCNKRLHCNCTRQFKTPKGLYGVTFDGFIFMPKIEDKIYNNLDYEVNHMGAENKFIYEFKKNGYNVICLNKDIRAIHRHSVVFHNRKDWISIDNTFKPMNYYCNIHKHQRHKSYDDKIVGGGIPFYMGAAKFH